MNKQVSFKRKSILLLLLFCFLLAGCTKAAPATAEHTGSAQSAGRAQPTAAGREERALPVYAGQPSVVMDGNVPSFTEADLTTTSFEHYSELDSLGRCGVAYACLGQDLMPTGERESITEIHPTGWQYAKYDWIDHGLLYNRCHLIAYCLAGENANEKNLITGTHYMNNDGMNPYENYVADYIDRTGHHVLYRVTPVFEGDNLVASGVEMEAMSVEDDAISFHVYCFNVQPGVRIDYATGDNERDPEVEVKREKLSFPEGTTYILNTKRQKFHRPDCESVAEMSSKNRMPTDQSREQLIEEGYKPCGNCKP